MGILRTDRVSGLGGANAIKGSVYLHGGDDSSGSQTMNMKDSSLAIGTNEFCCDFWMYWVDIPSHGVRVVGNLNLGSYTNAQSWGYLRFADGTSRLWNGSSWVSTGADNFVAGRWYHIAIIRNSGNNQGLYIDGSLQSTTVSNTNNWTNDEFDINGRASDGAESGRIFFSNVRLTIGSGASDLGGIVPVGESEVLADTKILCCNSPGNVLNESAQGIPITTGRNSTANASVGTASRFTPNSPVGFSTTTDVGSQHGSTFDGFGSFATSTYMVPPGGNTRERFPNFKAVPAASARGLFGGGSEPFNTKLNLIEFITISTTGNAQDFGDLTVARGAIFGCSSNVRGVFAGGASPSADNIIDFVTISTTGDANDFGDLTTAARNGSGASNSTRGVFALGNAGAYSNSIDFITIFSGGNSSNFGDLTQVRDQLGSCASSTRGLFAGGLVTPTPAVNLTNIIDFITISNTANAIDFGDLLQGGSNGIRRLGGLSNSTRGLFAGGESTGAQTNIISFITMATAGDAQDFGDLSAAVTQADNGASSSVRGVFHLTAPANTTLHYVTIDTLGNSTDFGDMTSASTLAGMSNGHGGLG